MTLSPSLGQVADFILYMARDRASKFGTQRKNKWGQEKTALRVCSSIIIIILYNFFFVLRSFYSQPQPPQKHLWPGTFLWSVISQATKNKLRTC